MLRTRVAALVFGAALAVGGSVAAAIAPSATASPSGSAESETTLPATGGPVTLTIAGVGTVTFTVDATGAISNLVVTPVDGVTVGTPVVTDEGVQVQLTGPGGVMRVLEISAKHDDDGIEVETEVEVRDPEAVNEPGEVEHHDGNAENHQPDPEASPAPEQTTIAPHGDNSGGGLSGGDSSGGDHSGGGDGGGDSGGQ
jgi:uncharacterized membrane protein YgcG